jgi:hypothetical protein
MNLKYRWIVMFLGTCIAILALAFESRAQRHDGFIYGKVYTDNNIYTGPIRWGNEEVLWTDLFNASKTDDSFENLVPREKEEDESWLDYDWSFSSIWENKTIHQFTCQFGNLSEITNGRRKINLKFKNGGELNVTGEGYNDLGSDIQIADEELGTISIKWERITKIQFLPTPSKLPATFGMPIYGTVEGVRKEKFTGFIVWDNDERLTTDRLDGDADDGDISIKFADISSIERDGRGSRVVLKSGREFYLTGSNDVNNENRGVLVVTPDLGIVKLSWSAFRRVTFSKTETTGPSFDDFASPKPLKGTVYLIDDEKASGRIIYDIDEALDFELVEGMENDINYYIPLKNIRTITPKNFDYSMIELVSGKSVLLGGSRDISSENGGLLVFVSGKKTPSYIAWKKIIEIKLN